MTLEQFGEKLFGQKKAETVPAKELPKKAAGKVSARMEKAKQNYRSAPKQQYVTVGRSIHVANSSKDDAKTYLREEYERDGEMFCQLCQRPSPFLSRDGQRYFEATQVFMRMHKDITEQFLALCPQCYAKYNEWIRLSAARAQALKESIRARRPKQGEESVRIPLPGDAENDVKSPLFGKTLYFTGMHFIDLRQAVLEDDELGEPED